MDQTVGAARALTRAGMKAALGKLGAAGPGLWAVLSTETSGCGFQPDGRPKILFERHIFHHLTSGRYDSRDPDVSAPSQGGYGAPGAHQYVRLHAAMLLDRDAAQQSASWGLGQIMGFNHAAAGYKTVQAMVDAFAEGEDAQLAGMAAFMVAGGLAASLVAKDWPRFARLYNGPDYAKNNYDGNLRRFCGIYEAHGEPDLMLRAAQMYLTFLGKYTGGIDGIKGRLTDAAIRDFCLDTNRPLPTAIDQPLIDALSSAVTGRRTSAS